MKEIPNDIILFISGVPSAGKTTISYELLKRYDVFRVIQETDIVREILRGYNEYLITQSNIDQKGSSIILPHTELLSYAQAKSQCDIIKYSIREIVERQKRKKIPTIINGVHIIPEILYEFIDAPNIKYINLFFDSEESLYEHLKERDTNKYGFKSVPFLYEMNCELQKSIEGLQMDHPNIFATVNVGKLNINETLDIILHHIQSNS